MSDNEKDLLSRIKNLEQKRNNLCSTSEITNQFLYEKKLKSVNSIMGILAIILLIPGAVIGFVLYAKGASALAPIIGGAIGVVVDLVIGKIFAGIKKSSLNKKINLDLIANYRELQTQIDDCNIELSEINALEKRKNTLFIGAIRFGISRIDNYNLNITVDGINYGNIYGAQSYALEKGRHIIGGNFECVYSSSQTDTIYTIKKVLQSISVEVGDEGAFIYFSLTIPSYTSGEYKYEFKELSSREFNKAMDALGEHTYY